MIKAQVILSSSLQIYWLRNLLSFTIMIMVELPRRVLLKRICINHREGAVPTQEIIGRCRLLDSFQHIILRLLNIDDDDAPHLDKDCDCVDEVATGDKSDGA